MLNKSRYSGVRSRLDHRSEIPLPPDPFKKQLDIVAFQMRKTIRSRADILEASSRFGVYPSTIQKILDGRTLSFTAKNKICGQADNSRPPKKPGNHQPVSVTRLKQVYRLYQDKGTLAGVGREIGVTRERVRQLMRTGSELKLFDYKPYRPPVIPKKRLLKNYKKHPTLKAVGKLYNVSGDYIARLFSSYGIDSTRRHALRVSLVRAAKKRRLIASYRRIRKELGHHPTATEMELRSRAWHGLYQKIIRLWGSIHAFRSDLGIPHSTKRLFAAWQQDPRFAPLVAAERARRKERLLGWYRRVKKRLGHDPTTTEIEKGPKSWRRLPDKIRYQWGSFDAFRKELGIPTFTKKSRSLRRRYQERGLDLRRDAR